MGFFLFPKEGGFSLLLATAIIQAACKTAEHTALSEEKGRCSNHNSSFLIETEGITSAGTGTQSCYLPQIGH